jgi:hypothetical protein
MLCSFLCRSFSRLSFPEATEHDLDFCIGVTLTSAEPKLLLLLPFLRMEGLLAALRFFMNRFCEPS